NITKHGLKLALKSRMLFVGDDFYMNGEEVNFKDTSTETLKNLADKRQILPNNIDNPTLLKQLYDWYLAGYICFDFE
ncbi:MAG: winged helix domain-containing protein, partial [Methylophilaceae bacterium]